MSTSVEPRIAQPNRVVSRRVRPGVLGVMVFGLLLVWRFEVLDQPPLWDGAMSVAPAAITLAESDYDLPYLLQQPGYQEGGPNVHATSAVTLAQALIILAVGDYQTALPLLHLISFALAGLVAAGVARVVGAFARPLTAYAAGVASVAFPPMIVQASDVYLDLPLAAAVVWSLAFAVEGRLGFAVVASFVAVWVKPMGLIAPLMTASVLILLGRRRAAPWLALPLVPLALPLLVSDSAGSFDELGRSAAQRFLDAAGLSFGYMRTQPDLLLLLALTAGLGIASIMRDRAAGAAVLGEARNLRTVSMTATLIGVACFYAVIFANPLISRGAPALPRYSVVVVPLLLIALSAALSHVTPTAAPAVLVVVGAGFLLNAYGVMYPFAGNTFALSERSLAYEDHLRSQQDGLDRIGDLGKRIPVFYDLFAHYRFAFLDIGWAEEAPGAGTSAYLEPRLDEVALDALPDRFAMLLEAAWLGGAELDRIWQLAQDDPSRAVDVEEYRSGPYVNYVVTVSRAGVDS